MMNPIHPQIHFLRKPFTLHLFILAVTCITIYCNSVTAPFHFDDIRFIVENPYAHDPFDIAGIWQNFNRRFVTGWTLSVNYYLHGADVRGFHGVNIAIHLGCGLLVYFLTLLIFQTPALTNHKLKNRVFSLAFVASLIFLTHPLATNVTTYIWQRSASLACLFYLATFAAYLLGRLGALKRWYVISGLFMIFGLHSKEITVTLPFMIFGLELFFFDLHKSKKRLLVLLGSALVAVYLLIPILTWLHIDSPQLHDLISLPKDGEISRQVYFATQMRVVVTYLRLLVMPIHLNLDYDYPLFHSLLAPQIIPSMALLLGLSVWACFLFKRYRLLSFGIFWFFVTLAPESSFIPIKDVIFEHRLYLPLFGFTMFTATICAHRLITDRNVYLVGICLALILSFLTVSRNQVWKSELSLWQDVVSKSPQKARPHSNLSMAYGKVGDYDKAIQHAERAIRLDPQFAQAYYNLGLAYGRKKDMKQSIAFYKKAIEANPEYSKAFYNLALTYRKTNQYDLAIERYEKALELKPNYVNAHNNLAVLLIKTGAMERAKIHIEKLKGLGRSDLATKLEKVLR